MIKHLGQRLPGFFACRRRTSALKAEMNSELAILRPKPTATGMSISPHELRLCLLYLYHWLRGEELWRFFGDACNLGKETTTILGITCINNELALNNIKWHSPKEVWITNIFALKDSRSNLEANLGVDGGEVNSFIHSLRDQGHSAYAGMDAMFLDALLGGDLSPSSNLGWNIYIEMPKSEKGKYEIHSGRRSNFVLKISCASTSSS